MFRQHCCQGTCPASAVPRELLVCRGASGASPAAAQEGDLGSLSLTPRWWGHISYLSSEAIHLG